MTHQQNTRRPGAYLDGDGRSSLPRFKKKVVNKGTVRLFVWFLNVLVNYHVLGCIVDGPQDRASDSGPPPQKSRDLPTELPRPREQREDTISWKYLFVYGMSKNKKGSLRKAKITRSNKIEEL